MVKPGSKPAFASGNENSAREVVGMKRWLRLTARKHSNAQRADNDAAKAAADALAAIIRTPREIG